MSAVKETELKKQVEIALAEIGEIKPWYEQSTKKLSHWFKYES